MNEQNKKNILIRLAFTGLLAILLSIGINKKVQADDDDACPTCYKDDMDLELNDSMYSDDSNYSDLDSELDSSMNNQDEEVVLDDDEISSEPEEHHESLESPEEEMNESAEEEAAEYEESDEHELSENE